MLTGRPGGGKEASLIPQDTGNLREHHRQFDPWAPGLRTVVSRLLTLEVGAKLRKLKRLIMMG